MRSSYGKYFFDTLAEQSGLAPQLLVHYFATRTRFLDDVVMDAVSARGITQVVIAGCGGDARAYRLPLPPHVHVFELDFPAVMAYRAGVLGDAAARCHVHAVPCDLSQPQWPAHVLAAGLQPALKSLWLVEGLLMYLKQDEIERFVASIAALSGPGSMLAGDVQNQRALTSPFSEPFRKAWYVLGHPMVSGIDSPERFLAPFGFSQCTVVEREHYADRFGYANPKMLAAITKYPRSSSADIERTFFFVAQKPVLSSL